MTTARYFDSIHSLLDDFEEIYKEMSNGDVLKNYYNHKVKYWRAQYPKKNREKIINRKTLGYVATKIARWVAFALDEIYKRQRPDSKLIKKIESLHTECNNLVGIIDYGKYTFLEFPSPVVSSDEEE